MSLPPETVTSAASGLVFENYYLSGVTEAYRGAILAAEHEFQSRFTDSVKVVMSFDLQAMSPSFSASNDYNIVHVDYATLVAALTAHATTADDRLAVAGLPLSDPSHGRGFDLAAPQARIMGLAQQTFSIDDAVVLNANIGFTFGRDAIGAIEHEMSEGVFGRFASLGVGGKPWASLDLFRFDAAGVRDVTGGADGAAAFFGIDGGHVSTFQFHGGLNAAGVSDRFDLGDWDHTQHDAFGATGPGDPGSISATDLQTLDVIGWTPASNAVDQVAVVPLIGSGGAASAVAGEFLTASALRTEIHAGAGNDTIVGASVADYLRGGDGNDSISGGSAFDDLNGNAGNDTLHGNDGDDWVVGGKGDDLLFGDNGNDLILGNLGNDSLVGGAGADQLRGGQGDDMLDGGAGDDFISGDRGNDTEAGGAGADTFHFFKDAGIDRVLDFNYAEGDRVELDLDTSFSYYQSGADTIIDTGNGNQMILVGVQLSSLPAGWIFEG